jgi:hypothetical protein
MQMWLDPQARQHTDMLVLHATQREIGKQEREKNDEGRQHIESESESQESEIERVSESGHSGSASESERNEHASESALSGPYGEMEDGQGLRADGAKICADARALRRIALRRWNTMLHRIKAHVGKRLGPANWGDFCEFVRTTFRAQYLQAFFDDMRWLGCCGPLAQQRERGCRACPHRFGVDLRRCGWAREMAGLHFDHTHDRGHVCGLWFACMTEAPRSWDDGICGLRVAHLLCGAAPLGMWPASLRLRCGPSRTSRHQLPLRDYCHRTDSAHYSHALSVSDIRGARSAA